MELNRRGTATPMVRCFFFLHSSHVLARRGVYRDPTVTGPKRPRVRFMIALILGAAAFLLTWMQDTLTVPGETAGHRASVGTVKGTAESITQQGRQARIVLRVDQARLVSLTVTPTRRIVSRDGRNLRTVDLRPGDQLRVAAAGTIVDSSQRVIDLQGIVVFAPDPSGGSMALEVASAGSILMDITPTTLFQDPSGRTASLTDIVDADVVKVRGVLDGALGEMTQTDRVVRLSP